MRRIPLRSICFALLLIVISYHVIFGGWRILKDFKSPMGSADNTIVAFGNQLRTGIFQEISPQLSDTWFMLDIQPEKQIHLNRALLQHYWMRMSMTMRWKWDGFTGIKCFMYMDEMVSG